MAAIAGLVAEAREGWSPPDWYKDAPPGTDPRAGGRPGMTERFQPGGVTHALVSGLVELALASALLAGSLAASESSPGRPPRWPRPACSGPSWRWSAWPWPGCGPGSSRPSWTTRR